MKATIKLLFTAILSLTIGCSEDDSYVSRYSDSSSDYLSSESSGSGSSSSDSNNVPNKLPGLITAAEWNDIDNWDFWKELINGQEYYKMSEYWNFYTNNRISVFVKNNDTPIVNAKIELLKNEYSVWTTKTDNFGKAELWIDLFQKKDSINLSEYTLLVNEQKILIELNSAKDGLNEITINTAQDILNKVEISFIIDATGSMGDELEFLKADLKDVIQKVQHENSMLNILTSTVFYRDLDDEYVVRKSDFTDDLNRTIDFINQQVANGGGDFPEAVHTALNTAINELQWSDNSKTRIAFLLLDAPPHYTEEIKYNINDIAGIAANRGIKIIPITASGIDKETEFLMRFLSITTNGTYVFITDDSGIGNDHLEASVGEYQVEYLNDLIVRLINKYTD